MRPVTVEVAGDRRLGRAWLALALFATALAALLLLSGATRRLDNVIYDALLRAAPRTGAEQVLIVAIDDRSLAELGSWPWPRSVHARIVDKLHQAGVRAVAYDVLFVEPTRRDDDEALGQAIARSGRVCLPVLTEAPGPDGQSFRIQPPLPAIAAGAAGLGHVNLIFDPDGVSRRADLLETADAGRIRHLIRCALDVGLGRPRAAEPLPSPAGGAHLERREVVLAPFSGPAGTFRTVSAASLLAGEVPQGYLRDRYVIVGATASGLYDRHSTPLSTEGETMTGAEFQANLLEGLLSGHLVHPAPTALTLALTLALVWAQLASLRLVSPSLNLALATGVIAVAVGGAAAALILARIWIAPASAILTVAIVFPLWGWRRLQAASDYLFEELSRLTAESSEPAPRITGMDFVGRRIAQLREAAARVRALREAADRAVAAREQTLHFLSHDIRAPQSAILALLETEGDGASPPLVRGVERHARRTLQLADDFVHLAKAEAGRLTHESIDVADLLDVAADEAWPLARKAGVRLVRTGETDGLWVDGDRSLLSRAIGNLIGNAIKFSPVGGEIELGAEATTLSNARAARLWVRDQGPGVPPDAQAGLFKAYERASGTRAPGVGLGLALVAEVARRHQGTVSCESVPGEGAAFSLVLPLSSGA